MKKLLVLILLITCINAHAQDSLTYFNQSREHIKISGMKVLGSWAVANIAVGAIGNANTMGQTKYFHQMNAIWNVVNLGAAVACYIGSKSNTDKAYTSEQSLKEQHKVEKIFLINGGLDLAYVGAGLYLNNRGNSNNDDKLKGYGSAIIFQGAFLLLFDATMYTAERHNGKKLVNFLKKNPLTFDGKRIGMVFKLDR